MNDMKSRASRKVAVLGPDLRKSVTRKATTCGNVIDAFAEAC
jgi:hypothetical protein